MPTRDDILAELLSILPPGDAGDIELQARGILRILLEPISRGQVPSISPRPDDPTACPNCDAPCSLTRSPYCSSNCRETAGFVRQLRAGLADGAIFDPERQVAFGQNLWQLLGGGLPLRRHLVPPKVVAQVIAKQGGTCAACSAPAVAVDHIGTACNRPINLRAVCLDCSRTKPFGDPSVLARPESETLLGDLIARIGTHEAVRSCDDAASWDWRVFLAKRHTASQA